MPTDAPPPTTDASFTIGFAAGVAFAASACESRAKKHAVRPGALAKDRQSEADACAFAIRKAATKRLRQRG